MKFTNILFPVDFSERCRAVAPFVGAAARRDRACLTLVSFVDASVLWYGTAEAPCLSELNIPRMIEETELNLTFLASEFFPDMQKKILVGEGDPGSGIVEAAR